MIVINKYVEKKIIHLIEQARILSQHYYYINMSFGKKTLTKEHKG